MHSSHPTGADDSKQSLRLLTFALVLITFVGAVVRFAYLGSLPPGLYRDEAYNGLDALAVLEGHTPLYFEANNGREPLFIYLLALPVALLGASPLALRLVSAVVGTLTIPTVYWLTRELTSPLEALLAAFLCATTVWSVNLSRVAFRAVVMVPLLAASLALWCRASRHRSWSLALVAGMVYGLSWYTYLPARFVVLAFGIAWLVQWRRERGWWRGWLLFGLGATIVAAPLLWYMVTHWEATVERASQVSVFNPAIHGGEPWHTLAQNAWHTLLAWVWRGDFIPRHNIPLRPVFQPLLAAAFALGIYLALKRARHEQGMVVALVFLAVMLLPTILAEGAPHFLRTTGVLPVLYVFPSLGVAHVARLASARMGQRNAWLLAGAILLVHAGAGMRAYYQHLHSDDVYYNFETGATTLAADLNAFLGTGWHRGSSRTQAQRAGETRLAYLASRLWENWPSVRFLCHGTEGLTLLPAEAPADAECVLVAAWPYENLTTSRVVLPRDRLITVREGAGERGDLEAEPRLLYIAFEASPLDDIPTNAIQRWDGGIALVNYQVRRLPTKGICVTLYWRCDEPIAHNYVAFVHLLDAGEQIGQHDGPTGLGYYPTDVWRPGDVVADAHPIEGVFDIHNELQIAVGLYDYPTMERLHLLAPDGTISDIDQLLLPLQP